MAKKEVVKKESALPAAASLEGWGDDSALSAQDIVIPRLLIQQFMSEKVKNKEAEYGEFRDTTNNELFGDLKTPFEVVPFYLQKKWIEFDMVPQRGGGYTREFKQVVPIDSSNDNLPLRDEEAKVERDRVMDFYVLIPKQVESGEAFPYILSFQRTSLKGGKKLATQMLVKNKMAGKNPAATAMLVSGTTRENDKGEFAVTDVKPSRASTEAEMKAALEWLQTIRSGATRADDSVFEESAASAVEEVTDF
jgi:hypothetical protein